MKKKMTFGLKMLLAFVGIMAIFLMTGCSDKPKESADKAVLAYAELYTFASSEHLSATGMTEMHRAERFQTASYPASSSNLPASNSPTRMSMRLRMLTSRIWQGA